MILFEDPDALAIEGGGIFSHVESLKRARVGRHCREISKLPI
jgi:hypothetical protein